MSDTHCTVADIIDAMGGVIPASTKLFLPQTTVGNWKARNSIPARYHHAVLSASDGKITAAQIVQAHAATEAA